MEQSVYDLQTNVYNVGESLKNVNEKLAQEAMNPAQEALENIKALKEQKAGLEERYNVLKQRLDEEKAKQAARTKPVKKNTGTTPEEKYDAAFAALVKKTMANENVGTDIYEALGDNDTSGGNKFLPKTVSTNIITQPQETNPLRNLSNITQIPNLEVPRLQFTLDDDGFIEDTETAKEIAAKGDSVEFTRNKFKVYVGMSETVLLGSNANLRAYVENGLRNGVITKERSVAFNETPSKDAEKHMSFYDASNDIKTVSGSDLYDAITKAIADLHESYRENATIVMSYSDYLKIIKTLANGSTTLYSAQPEQVLGKPVVFTDAAKYPIVGDFKYSQYNYDINTLYEQDKDVKTGVNYFVLTAWFDHRILLNSAFRIAKVGGSGN